MSLLPLSLVSLRFTGTIRAKSFALSLAENLKQYDNQRDYYDYTTYNYKDRWTILEAHKEQYQSADTYE